MSNALHPMPLIEALNRRDFDLWSAQVASNVRCDYPGAPGLDAATARAYNETYLRAFSNLHFAVEDEVNDGTTHVVVWSATGTHDGPLALPAGEVPPTGRSGSVRGVFIAKWQDGKVVREQSFWNQIELLQQLGLV